MTESNPDKTTRAILAISENRKELERKARTEKPRKRKQQKQDPTTVVKPIKNQSKQFKKPQNTVKNYDESKNIPSSDKNYSSL